jgi:hypothetical protein
MCCLEGQYLDLREREYDIRTYLDFFTVSGQSHPIPSSPVWATASSPHWLICGIRHLQNLLEVHQIIISSWWNEQGLYIYWILYFRLEQKKSLHSGFGNNHLYSVLQYCFSVFGIFAFSVTFKFLNHIALCDTLHPVHGS